MAETTEFVRACLVTDVADGTAVRVVIDGVPVAVVRSDGEFYAIHDVCSHAEVRLSEGDVYDGTLECWLHGSCFDIRTGKALSEPAEVDVATYPVKTEGGAVFVQLP